MPGFDQRGPQGQGPMTGRKEGKCTNFGNGNAQEKIEEAPLNQQNSWNENRPFGRGLGMQRGAGRGRGRTRGSGRRGGF